MSDIDDDGLAALGGPPATPAQRRRQQASQARFDHALGLVSAYTFTCRLGYGFTCRSG